MDMNQQITKFKVYSYCIKEEIRIRYLMIISVFIFLPSQNDIRLKIVPIHQAPRNAFFVLA